MYNFFIILTLVANTFPRIFQGIELWQHRKLYYIADALSFVLFAIADYYKPKIATRWNRFFYKVVLWLMISNLMDELFFNPLELGLNELIFALFIVISELIIYTCESKR